MTESLTRSTGRAADRAPLHRTADLAADFLEGLEDRPVAAAQGRDALLAALGGPLPPGRDAGDRGDRGPRSRRACGGRRDGWPTLLRICIGGSLPAALAADWLTSTWDQNAGIFVAGPAASVVEEVVGDWLVDLLGLPDGTSIGLTTGCQMAHFTCLAAARHQVLERAGWDMVACSAPRDHRRGRIGGTRDDARDSATVSRPGRSRVTVGSDDQGRMRLDDSTRPARRRRSADRVPAGRQREHRVLRPDRTCHQARAGRSP